LHLFLQQQRLLLTQAVQSQKELMFQNIKGLLIGLQLLLKGINLHL